MASFRNGNDTVPRASKRELIARVRDINESVSPKVLQRNTLQYLHRDGSTRILYHHTDVVIFRPDGSVELDTGGFNTNTTRERMNHARSAGVYVGSNRGLYVSTSQGKWWFDRACTIGADGFPLESLKPVVPPKPLRPVIGVAWVHIPGDRAPTRINVRDRSKPYAPAIRIAKKRQCGFVPVNGIQWNEGV